MFAGDLNYYVATTDGTASVGAGRLWGYVLIGNGAAQGSVSFLDGGSAGTEIWADSVTATAGDVARFAFAQGLKFDTNLYVDITTAAKVAVIFE